jgi:8-oxo-dGTP diphosphatase
MIDVVCAVIERQGLFLIGRRAKGKSLPDLFEFVGGKVEDGECFLAAVKREVREEIGAEVVVGKLLWPINYTYGHEDICLRPYFCKLTDDSAEPQVMPSVHSELVWVTVEELRRFKFAAANIPIVCDLERRAGMW